MINRIFLFIFFIHVFSSVPILAQEQKKNFLSSFQGIQKLFDGKDMLKETLNDVNEMKNEFYDERLGLDKETASILRTLKNPFLPQFPEPQEGEQIIKEDLPAPTAPVQETQERKPWPKETQTPDPVRPDFSISGLVWNSDRPQAIINGKIINIGDSIDSWIVVDIDYMGVEVTQQNKIYLIEP